MIPDKWIHTMPNWMIRTLFGTPVWKWFGLCLTLVLLIAVMWVIYRRGRGVAQAVRETSSIRYFFSLSFLVAAIRIPVMAKYYRGRSAEVARRFTQHCYHNAQQNLFADSHCCSAWYQQPYRSNDYCTAQYSS